MIAVAAVLSGWEIEAAIAAVVAIVDFETYAFACIAAANSLVVVVVVVVAAVGSEMTLLREYSKLS